MPLRLSADGRRVVAITTLAFVVLTAFVEASHASFPGRNGRIAVTRLFTSDSDVFPFLTELFTVDPRGRHQREVLDEEDDSPTNPAFSPDGRTIAYESRSPNGIYTILDAANAAPRRVTHGLDSAPAWSADGQRIAFERGGVIHSVRRDGSEVVRVGKGLEPTWSAKGDLAFVRLRGAPQRVVVSLYVSERGRPARRILSYAQPPPAVPPALDWSPGGTRIVLPRSDPSGGGVYVLRATGRGLRRITASHGENPSWSPDGTKIALARGEDGLYVMNADGSTERRLLNEQADSITWGRVRDDPR
jgi:Tol biopolymer transport system component